MQLLSYLYIYIHLATLRVLHQSEAIPVKNNTNKCLLYQHQSEAIPVKGCTDL